MYYLFIEVSVLVPILLSYILSTHYRGNRRFEPRGAFALSLPKSQSLISSILSYSLLFFLVSSLSSISLRLYRYVKVHCIILYSAGGQNTQSTKTKYIRKQQERGYIGGEGGYTAYRKGKE